MNNAVITTKIDLFTKTEAMKTAEELGLPLSVVIKAFLKQFIRSKSITFNRSTEEPNTYLRNIITQAEKNLKTKNHSPVFDSGDKAVNWLKKQGI